MMAPAWMPSNHLPRRFTVGGIFAQHPTLTLFAPPRQRFNAPTGGLTEHFLDLVRSLAGKQCWICKNIVNVNDNLLPCSRRRID